MPMPVLVIGEDAALLAVLRRALADAGYDAHARPVGEMGCWWGQDSLPAAIVLDVPPKRPALAQYVLDVIQAHPQLRRVPRVICCDVPFLEECARMHDAQSRLLLAPITLDELIEALVDLAPARDGVMADAGDDA